MSANNGTSPKAHVDPARTSAPAIDPDNDDENASISEHISFDDSNVDNDPLYTSVVGNSGIQPVANVLSVTAQKRQLFALGNDNDDDDNADEDMDDMDAHMFHIDDALLDGGRIAEHFRVDETVDRSALSKRSPPISLISQSTSQNKDVSPLNDDVILLNNEKISLSSLKQHQQLPPLRLSQLQLRPALNSRQLPALVSAVSDADPSSATTNQNTTNDVSEIGADVEDVDNNGQGDSDETELTEGGLDPIDVEHPEADSSSIEADQSIDECIVSIASISVDLVPKVRFTNLEAMSATGKLENREINLEKFNQTSGNVTNVNYVNNLLVKGMSCDNTRYTEANSLGNVSDGVLDLKQGILNAQLVARHEPSVEIVDENEVDAQSQTAIKPMGRIDASKEALDDISEVTEPSTDLNFPVRGVWSTQCLHSGTELRHVIQIQMAARHEPSVVIVDENEVDALSQTAIKPMGPIDASKEALDDISDHQVAETDAHSFDSVISLHMLEVYEQRIRELEAAVTTKEVCLSALSLRLQRSESNSAKSSDVPPPETHSLAETVSTEYRTYADDFGLGALGSRHEFHVGILEREKMIEQLTEALQQSMLSRELLQQQNAQTCAELQLVRRQLSDQTNGVISRPLWMMRSGELGSMSSANVGQRLSEISIDLVSEDDAEDQVVGVKEPQSDVQTVPKCGSLGNVMQMDEFEHSLSADEQVVFARLRKTFEEHMRQSVERVHSGSELELRILNDRLAAERNDKQVEVIYTLHLHLLIFIFFYIIK